MPAPPNMEGMALADSQALATQMRALIHKRMTVGNNPIGLQQPSLLGRSTIKTKSKAPAQLPMASNVQKRQARAAREPSESLRIALGEMLSAPSP
eukprot:11185928-Karenia_brevis.AAC.1